MTLPSHRATPTVRTGTPLDAEAEARTPRTEAVQVTGLVLAGGLARRMQPAGGAATPLDKGLQLFRGQPMIAQVIARLRPQVGPLLINANGDPARFAGLGLPVLPDRLPEHPGPLAGLHAGLHALRTPRLVTVPCDSPFLPLDLVARLAAALDASGAQVAVARTGAQPHPVFLMTDATVLPTLDAFLASGRRRIDAWYGALAHVLVDFDDEAAFRNINTPEELRAFESA